MPTWGTWQGAHCPRMVFCLRCTSHQLSGQGAFVITIPMPRTCFSKWCSAGRPLYIPFLVLSIMATVIASQAMISGILHCVPGHCHPCHAHVPIDYTPAKRQSQIYIGFVNWFLLFAVCSSCSSSEVEQPCCCLRSAVTGTMTLTGFMMTWIFLRRGKILACRRLDLCNRGEHRFSCFQHLQDTSWRVLVAHHRRDTVQHDHVVHAGAEEALQRSSAAAEDVSC